MWLIALIVCIIVGYIVKRINGYHRNLPPGKEIRKCTGRS